jgi:predicted NACHT family NTPase
MEKLAQLVITNIVKWTPIGVGIVVIAQSLLSHEWLQAILVSFLTAISSIWVKFSARFMEEAGREAEERGGGLAKWVFVVVDHTTMAIQEKVIQYWRNLTSDFEEKYYQRLIYTCRNYETQGLDTGRMLTLKNMFVPLKISQASLATISPDLIQKDSKILSRRLEIGSLLRLISQDSTFKRVAILGVPGSGKTTLMRYLTLIYANRKQRTLISRKAPPFIPVLIYLRDVREDIVRNRGISLSDLIHTWLQRLQPSDPLRPPMHWFSGKLKQSQCLIMLDGLDEIADESERQLVSKWVDSQMEQYPDTPFILTSRPLGYEHAKLEQPVTVLEVQPLTQEQVQKFVHNWYLETEIESQRNSKDLGVYDDAISRANDLVKRIRDSAPLVSMSVNPLLLTMITTVHRRGSALPGKRVELYKEICQILLERRRRAKGLVDLLTAGQYLSVLQGLALDLMLRNTRTFMLSDVEDLLRQRLSLVARNEFRPTYFLRHIREVSGLLVEKEEGVYEFVHLSFQEYLGSLEIRESKREQLLIDAMQNTSLLSWWGETIRLYAAQGDSTNIIKAAMQSSTIEAMALAYDCLEEGRSVDPSVRAQLETLLEEGLEAR